MKYSVAAVVAAAAGALADGHLGNVTVITEVVDVYTTYCPSPTEITYGTNTYTVTEATTLTITDCPCTITKPVIPTSTVVCHDCPPVHTNGTIPGVPHPTGGVPTEEPGAPEPAPTAGAAKVAGLSGLAGLAGLAAFFL